MKKYNEFIFEESKYFKQEFNHIVNLLSQFWDTLEDKMDIFDEINSRNVQDVINHNTQQKTQQKTQPAKPEQPETGVFQKKLSLHNYESIELLNMLFNPKYEKFKDKIIKELQFKSTHPKTKWTDEERTDLQNLINNLNSSKAIDIKNNLKSKITQRLKKYIGVN